MIFEKKERKKEIKDNTQGKALANLVPAAAVIREGQVLFIMTGRKGSVGGLNCEMCNSFLTKRKSFKNFNLEEDKRK